MPQRSNFIDVTRSMVIIDPQNFMPSLHDTGREDAPEQAPPVLAYTGVNILPTATGYKSFFGTNRTIDTSALPSKADHIFLTQTERFENIVIALCEDGIWTLRNQAAGWQHEVVLSNSVETASETEEVTKYREWSYCVVRRAVYMYRQGLDRVYYLTEQTETAIQEFVPTFLNMEAQMGIFRADNRLGFWDSANAVATSSLDDVQDFEPSLETLASIQTFENVVGRIVNILSHGEGFIIYATKSIVPVRSNKEGQFQWQELPPNHHAGIAYRREVCAGNPDTTHYALTTNGLLEIKEGRAEVIGTAIIDYLKEPRLPIYLSYLQGRYLFLSTVSDKVYNAVDFETAWDEGIYWESDAIYPLPIIIEGYDIPGYNLRLLLNGNTEDFQDWARDQLGDRITGDGLTDEPFIYPLFEGKLDAFFVDTDFEEFEHGCFAVPEDCDGSPEDPRWLAKPKASFETVEDLLENFVTDSVDWDSNNIIEAQAAIWYLANEALAEVIDELESLERICEDEVLCTPGVTYPNTIEPCLTPQGEEEAIVLPMPGVFQYSYPTNEDDSCMEFAMQGVWIIGKWKKMQEITYHGTCEQIILTPLDLGWPLEPLITVSANRQPLSQAFNDARPGATDTRTTQPPGHWTGSICADNALFVYNPQGVLSISNAIGIGAAQDTNGAWITWLRGVRLSHNAHAEVWVAPEESGCADRYSGTGDLISRTDNLGQAIAMAPPIASHSSFLETIAWGTFNSVSNQPNSVHPYIYFYNRVTMQCPEGYTFHTATGTCRSDVPLIKRSVKLYYEWDGPLLTESGQAVTLTREMVIKPSHLCISDPRSSYRECFPVEEYPCDRGWRDFEQGIGGLISPDSPFDMPDGTHEPDTYLDIHVPGIHVPGIPADELADPLFDGDRIEWPPLSFLLQDGSITPAYPTFEGAVVYDSHLQKWGIFKGQHKLLLDYSPVNEEGRTIIPYEVFGTDAGCLREGGQVALFDQRPEECSLTYGRIGSYRLGYTAVFEIRVNFREPATGRLVLDGSLDGRSIDPSLRQQTTFIDAREIIFYPKGSARWWVISIQGSYEITYLEFRGKPTKRR